MEKRQEFNQNRNEQHTTSTPAYNIETERELCTQTRTNTNEKYTMQVYKMKTGFCWSCGIEVRDNEIFCPKHIHTKPKSEKKGHWSGYSKLRAEEGNWQIHKE